MDEREKRVTQLERDARLAVDKAEAALDKRVDLLNEFRAQSANEQQNFARKADLDALKERVDIASGGRAMLISAAATMLAVLAIAVQFIR